MSESDTMSYKQTKNSKNQITVPYVPVCQGQSLFMNLVPIPYLILALFHSQKYCVLDDILQVHPR